MSSDSEVDETAAHHASLKRLKTKDPDFYEFLKENDQELLNFQGESEEDEADEDEEEAKSQAKVTFSASKIEYIKDNIKNKPSVPILKELIGAFNLGVKQAEGEDSNVSMANNELFNDVVKLCLVELVPCLHSILKLSIDEESKHKIDPTKSKLWRKLRASVKFYLSDLLKMFDIMKDPSILTLLLKHAINLVPFYICFVKYSRMLVKKMASLWSSEEETVRVLSLLVIVRCTRSLRKDHQSHLLKVMYFSYIKNSKFTSALTWPMINFMKRSLAEVYALNPEAAYEHAFVYIRQLAIHLRNAITTKKKESYQTIYNWQYIHCLLFWAHLLCELQHQEALKSLIYPLVQTITGTIGLIPTTRYVPLRIHLVKGLMYISEKTGTFIPTLPFILEILTITDYNKKSSFSVKPVDFTCALKVTKSQLQEAGLKDACLAEVCSLSMEYLKLYSNSISFPELSLPAVFQIKSFMKECKVAKYNQQLKGLLQKIEENCLFITDKRKNVTFGINDSDEVKRWEEQVKETGTPLGKLKNEKANVVQGKKEQTLSKKKKRKFKK